MPTYDFRETHNIDVKAPAEKVYQALNTCDLCDSTVIRWLFRLRGMPSTGLTIRQLSKMRFEALGKRENEEVLLGLAGKFWTPTGQLQKVNADNFREFDKKGFAKATWNFSLNELDKTNTRLTTETRIKTLDEKSLSRFGFYWAFVQPFSGWIRNEMLQIIKKSSEDT